MLNLTFFYSTNNKFMQSFCETVNLVPTTLLLEVAMEFLRIFTSK